jgi:Type II CAAX prenyl endopeptidase Rce1-like
VTGLGLVPTAQMTVLGLLILGYYGKVVRLVGEPLARRFVAAMVNGSALTRRWSVADVDGVVRLLLSGALQLSFLTTLVIALPVAVDDLLPASWDVWLMLLGVPLGIAEAALATYVAYLGSRFAGLVRRGGAPTTIEGWLSVARGGWIRYYLRTAEVAPRWLLVFATTLYVAGEELIFRGVVLADRGLPPAIAVAISVVLFAAAQVFYTPGWRTALFPVLGAIVLGIVHGCLFVTVPDVTPLIVAHVTMFLVTVL